MSSTLTTIGVLALLASSSAFNVNNNMRLSSIRNVRTDLQMVSILSLLLLLLMLILLLIII